MRLCLCMKIKVWPFKAKLLIKQCFPWRWLLLNVFQHFIWGCLCGFSPEAGYTLNAQHKHKRVFTWGLILKLRHFLMKSMPHAPSFPAQQIVMDSTHFKTKHWCFLWSCYNHLLVWNCFTWLWMQWMANFLLRMEKKMIKKSVVVLWRRC